MRDQGTEFVIHFDDPQQVVTFAAALVEAVYPERYLSGETGLITDAQGNVLGSITPTEVACDGNPWTCPDGYSCLHFHPDLSDAGTDRLLADLRDGE